VTGKDYEDWGGYPTSAQSYPLKDLAEAVVRLGSPMMFNRDGATGFLESFQYGLGRVNVSASDPTKTPVLSTAAWCSHGFSCYMPLSVVAGDVGQIGVNLLPMPPALWGFSCMFSIPDDLGYLQFYLDVHLDNVRTRYYVQVDLAGWKLQLYNDAGVWVDTINLVYLNCTTKLWHFLKVVIDPVNHRFVRVYLDNHVAADIATLPGAAVADFGDFIAWYIIGISAGAGQPGMYIDNLIATYNESD